MSTSSNLLKSVKKTAASSETWADVANAVFDPLDGLLSTALHTREQREAFTKTSEYKEIRKLIREARARSGLVEGAKPKKSGKFLARIPVSVHEALEKEAIQEGVSLNQLVVSKLSISLADSIAAGSKSKADPIVQAFLEVRDGYSADRVVADPNLNRIFISRARDLGATGSSFDLNWTLLNARKSGRLVIPTKTRRFSVEKRDEFEFATEMAVRYLQHVLEIEIGSDISLDKIICNPEWAARFDSLAIKLCPGFSSLEYRWVALGLRKARRLSKESSSFKASSDFDDVGDARRIQLRSIPCDQGLYLIRSDDKAVFVGETDNLRHRLELHFESASGQNVVPDWLYNSKSNQIQVGIIPLQKDVTHQIRKEWELNQIGLLQPILNYIHGKPRGPMVGLSA